MTNAGAINNSVQIINLSIELQYDGQTYAICPSLIVYKDELTLVDTGYPGFLPQIEDAILQKGYHPDQLTGIIITHYDDDHIGSLYDFKEKYPAVRIIASQRESKAIAGEVKSERLRQAEQLLEEMDEQQAESGREFVEELKRLRAVPVNFPVQDGDRLMDGHCEVLATPGHTSGHISLYFPELKSVITGDAAVLEEGELAVANPQYAMNLVQAEQSLSLLKSLDARTYYIYHSGVYLK